MAAYCSSSEDSDVLMTDPFLDCINEMLMEEGMDEATCMPQVDDLSYQAIFSGFCDILGEHLLPKLYVDSTSDECVFDPHVQHQSMCFYHENGHVEKNFKVVNPNDGFSSMASEPRISLPANGHPQSSFQQERAEVGFTLKHNSGFQGHSHTPLSSTKDTAAQNYNSAINLNDGVLMDVMVSCWGKDAVVEGLKGHIGQEHGNGKFQLPSADEEFSLKLAELDVSFKDLKLNSVYTDLYVGEPSSSTRAARDSKCSGDKKKSLAGKGSKSGQKSTSEVQVFADVREVLVSCAEAVAIGDARRANEILQELRQVHGASANGTGLQRTAHFFSEALVVRLRGMGEQHFRTISRNRPSSATLLRASKFGFEVTPYVKVMHYFANQSILKAAEGASMLHVVDYGLMHGMQWPCLMNALADRKGGPPLLVITGIEFPQPGVNPAEMLGESGRRLAAYAKTYGVPFQYHAIASNKWEDVDAASLHLHKGEVLVVNSLQRLRHVADEGADLALTISPRQKLLTFMQSLNPHLLVTGFVNAACNSPFFVTRFREAMYFFSNVFDMLGTLWGDSPQRLTMERSCFYRDIVNIVACEGAERVERPENYKRWHARITKAGFKQLPIPPAMMSRSRSHVKQNYHKDFYIHDDANGWMLMGWKGRTTLAISAWKPHLV